MSQLWGGKLCFIEWALAEDSQRNGIMLAPGTVFRPHLERSPWMRFNVAVCEDTRVQRWLQQLASRVAAQPLAANAVLT